MSYCPKCGAELPDDAPEGLCPSCLVQAGFDSQDELERSAATSDPVVEPTAQSPAGSGTGLEPPSPEELATVFPQLEIQELLGHGGMGAVYAARQTKLDRLVALKIIRPESADDPAFAERFNREARTLARINHPNIVAVHDFGEVTLSDQSAENATPRTLYYFLMEYVDGANLRQLIQSGELQPQQALAIVPEICGALQFAHDEGVVHRDIKPENILLDRKGRVKIADFGLAKLASKSPDDFTLTGTHQVMGTPRYMAPEQMEGSHSVDHRADIYSLGVVFYEMLTGELPVGRFLPPSEKVHIDVRLDEVVLRALAKEPERRYQQASDVKTDVESITREPETAAVYAPNDKCGSERVDQPISRTANIGREWPRRCALFVSAVGILSGLIFEWTKTPGHWTQTPGHLFPTILLACLFFFLLAAEGAGRVLWWWFLLVCYVGFAVAALAFAEGLAASGPLAVFLCGGVLVGVGAVEFGRRLVQSQRIGQVKSNQNHRHYGWFRLGLWLLTFLLFGVTVMAAAAWGNRGRGSEDINALLVPLIVVLFVFVCRLWVSFFSRDVH